MKEISIFMASVLPTETLIEKLEEAIKDYKIDQSEKSLDFLCFTCQMLLIHKISKSEFKGDFTEMINEYKRFEDERRIFNPPKQ